MEINDDLCEIIGIILGDGHIHRTQNLITIVGSLEDFFYFKEIVIPLFERTFQVTPSMRRRNDRNAFYLMVCSKRIVDFLTLSCSMIRGSKEKAFIPPPIFTKQSFMISFLRGIFDTDGCLKFSKQSKNINYYPRVQIGLRQSPLAKELKTLFQVLGYSYSQWFDSRFNGLIFYQISGNINTRRWFDEIKPHNRVQISKYEFWSRFGYYLPKSSMEERIIKLSSTIF